MVLTEVWRKAINPEVHATFPTVMEGYLSKAVHLSQPGELLQRTSRDIAPGRRVLKIKCRRQRGPVPFRCHKTQRQNTSVLLSRNLQ